MEDSGKAVFKLKKFLKELSSYSGGSTELISVYIPPSYPIFEMSNKLKNEAGQASNIKSKSTRKNVQDALEKIIGYLKIFRETPKNGLVIFCGNVSDNPAKTDIKLFSLEPPEPLNIQLYRCDSKFFLEPLQNLLEVKDTYGIVVMDGREATLATVRGTNIQILKRLNSTAHAKIRKGGQSARRFERLIEESIERYYKRVGEAMDQYFLSGIKGVIIGGPGPTKEFFYKEKPFNYQIKILGVVDTGYTDEYGIREVLSKSEEILENQELISEKKLIDSFMKEVAHGGLAIYGEPDVRKALEAKAVSLLLLSEGLSYLRARFVSNSKEELFFNLKNEQELKAKEAELSALGFTLAESKPLIDDFMEIAEKNNIEVKLISKETDEGLQFLQSFYGIGAFLRYKR
ncbi:MAG: peptide chain release factor aRF-1 [Candidatus Anstonellales archaeon]